MITSFPKVPPQCLTGIITALYPKETKSLLREEGPEQGYPERQMVEYSMSVLLTDIRVVPDGQLRRNEAAVPDQPAEQN